MDIARAAALILATMTVGAVAGIVGLYANTLMRIQTMTLHPRKC